MPRKRGTLILALLGAMLVACGRPPTAPEESLRQWVDQGQRAVNDKDRGALLEMLSEAYADGRGNSRDDIGKLLQVYFFRMNNVAVLASVDELRIIGDTAAELVLTVGMAGTHDGTLGFSADAYTFEMELELDDGVWRLLGARWGEMGQELH